MHRDPDRKQKTHIILSLSAYPQRVCRPGKRKTNITFHKTKCRPISKGKKIPLFFTLSVQQNTHLQRIRKKQKTHVIFFHLQYTLQLREIKHPIIGTIVHFSVLLILTVGSSLALGRSPSATWEKVNLLASCLSLGENREQEWRYYLPLQHVTVIKIEK